MNQPPLPRDDGQESPVWVAVTLCNPEGRGRSLPGYSYTRGHTPGWAHEVGLRTLVRTALRGQLGNLVLVGLGFCLTVGGTLGQSLPFSGLRLACAV